ncbi:MAG: ThuA domain-containing protein [Akkermansiaceae bacterium]
MNIKPLTISAVALFGVFGLYVASAKPEKANDAKMTNEMKIKQALKQAELEVPDGVKEGDDEKKKILVFSKTNGFRHKSIGVGKQTLELMAESSGAFDVVISDDLENFDKGKIEGFDAICFLNTTMDVFSPNKKQLKKMSDEAKENAAELDKVRKVNLMNFIEGGKGFIGIHAATDTFYEWPEYGEMLGGYFDGHPWRHNMEVSIKADKKNKSHALLNGVIPADKGELRFNEEIYQHKDPYDSNKVTMLLRLDADASDKPKNGIKRKDKDFGVSWVKPHKKGRVFYSSLGHNDHIYWNKNVLKHYYNGIIYALGE